MTAWVKFDIISKKTDPFKLSNKMKEEKKKESKEKLDKWYGMKKQEIDKETENELVLMKLRRYLSPTNFFKRDEIIGLPKYFEVKKNWLLRLDKKYQTEWGLKIEKRRRERYLIKWWKWMIKKTLAKGSLERSRKKKPRDSKTEDLSSSKGIL